MSNFEHTCLHDVFTPTAPLNMTSDKVVLTSVNPIVIEPLVASNKLDFTRRQYGSFINESGIQRVSSVQIQPDYLSCHNITQLLEQKTWLRELPPKVILNNIR